MKSEIDENSSTKDFDARVSFSLAGNRKTSDVSKQKKQPKSFQRVPCRAVQFTVRPPWTCFCWLSFVCRLKSKVCCWSH